MSAVRYAILSLLVLERILVEVPDRLHVSIGLEAELMAWDVLERTRL